MKKEKIVRNNTMNPNQIKPRRITKLLYGVKQLREETGASFSHIRAALKEAENDSNRAKEILQNMSEVIAMKKESRVAKAGLVEAYVHNGATIGALLEVRCETDFVARNPLFKEFAHDLAMHIAATNPRDVSSLMDEPFVKDESRTVKELIAAHTASFGEHIEIARFIRYAI